MTNKPHASFRRRLAILAPLIAVTSCMVTGHALARTHAKPLECSAIIFQGVAPGTGEGSVEEGYYPTHFGRLALTATVHQGSKTDYKLSLNGQALLPISKPMPEAVMPCLRGKRAAPLSFQATANCVGNRFKIILMTDAHSQYALLYAMNAGSWRFCEATQPLGQ